MTVVRAPLALLVEPDQETRDLYGGVLRRVAAEIEYAEDGREALAKAISRRPALVITETRLAFISGYTLCSLLRSDPNTTNVAIVFVTDDADPPEMTRARALGADSVLTKPVLPEKLLEAVERGRSRRSPSWSSDVTRGRLHAQRVTSIEPGEPRVERSRRSQVSAHQRFETSTPPVAPPPLRCKSCDGVLRYVHSYVGGVSARLSEQWDYYACANGCGTFQYRQRTRRLRRVE
jgi:CheY-like chemotaxis protein